VQFLEGLDDHIRGNMFAEAFFNAGGMHGRKPCVPVPNAHCG
jgi:hypothetical protein